MAVLYGSDAFSISVRSTKKRYSSSLKKFSFSKNTKIIQNFRWSSHEKMPISPTESYFENP